MITRFVIEKMISWKIVITNFREKLQKVSIIMFNTIWMRKDPLRKT